jgi:hypothetical protein
MFKLPQQSSPALLLLAGVCLCLPLTGCIRSKVTITSDPPQAEVSWRGRPRGVTPITIPYIWYWHYDVSVEKEGHERLEVVERFRTPPWFLMPLDLFMEILPIPFSDHRHRHYVLEPKEETS